MAPRQRPAARAGRGGRDNKHPADNDALGQALDQAIPADSRRVKRRRAARELAEKIPADGAIEVLVDIAQNFLPW